jgi:hypothetical protein
MFLSMMCIVDKLSYNLIWCAASVSNPVYTDTGIPVFGTPNTDTGKNLPVLAGINGIFDHQKVLFLSQNVIFLSRIVIVLSQNVTKWRYF